MTNPAHGVWDAATGWRVVEELRIGAKDGTGPEVLGQISALAEDVGGRIWALEAKEQAFKIFDREGRFIRTVGRQGGGPGEFRQVAGVAQTRDRHLLVVDFMGGRISLFDTAGVFLRGFPMSAGFAIIPWPGRIDTAGYLYSVVARPTAGAFGFALVRYDTDGSLDTSFGGDGKVTTDFTRFVDDGLAVALQPDGKIVMVGGAGFGGPNERFALARYNTDGSPDTTFGGDGKLTTDFSPYPDVAFAVAIQGDGHIVVAGGARLLPYPNPTWALARYDTDGSLDTSFGGDGKVTTDFTRGDDDAYSMALQADGKIVVAGQAALRNAKFALARYGTDGSLDPTFGADGKLVTNITPGYDSAFQVVIQPDGKIVAAGTAGFTRFAVWRYLAA